MPSTIQLLEDSANLGNEKAIIKLAEININNPSKSIKWFKKIKHLPIGRYGIGIALYQEHKYADALIHIQKAAELKYVKAYSQLAYMYYTGQGTTQDIEQAKYWYGQASKSGDSDAMYNLAILLDPNHKAVKQHINVRTVTISTILLTILIPLVIWGCNKAGGTIFNPPPSPLTNIQGSQTATTQISQSLQQQSGVVENNSKRLEKAATSIKDDASKGKELTPDSSKLILAKYWDNIINTTSELFAIKTENDKVNSALVAQKLKVDDLTKRLAEAIDQSNKLEGFYSSKLQEQSNNAQMWKTKFESEKKSGLQKRLALFSITCIAGVGIFIVIAICFNQKLGIAGAIGCGSALVVTMVFSQVEEFISDRPWIIGLGLLAVISFAVYRVYKLRKTTIQTTKMFEAAKQIIPDNSRKWFFGDGALEGEVVKYQTNDTRRIVNHIRQHIRKARELKPAEVPASHLGSELPLSP